MTSEKCETGTKVGQLSINTGSLTVGSGDVVGTESLTYPLQAQLEFLYCEQKVGKFYRLYKDKLIFGWKDSKWVPIKLERKGGVKREYVKDNTPLGFHEQSEEDISPRTYNADDISEQTPYKEIFAVFR